MDISALKRDAKAVAAGQWIGDLPGMEDARLCVRGLSSPSVVVMRSAKERKVSKKGRNADGSLKPDIARKILGEVLFEGVLIDWDGLTSEGKPLPYDKALAEQWCTDPDYEAFADAVVYAAGIVDRGIADTTEDVAGNSKRSSAGNSSGASAPKD
ncbi:hypothetical protein C7441_11010 [Pseudaminobacter salicylatoxidans]|uniref:Tail assembly chaperone n=1 Tax=Pseudaminobacter salicylatoxidans TaxID=93369 RepID=A0A316C0P8_PSESE|nr:hypothetical protein [Pseudaminobacter salicylatoxidans]PWJ81479.1 hypothetical protein C7441_11010 [Pseudaminobacter salicylatoxidans]